MDGIEDNLFQKVSFDSSDNSLEDYSPNKVQGGFRKCTQDIPITFDRSSYKNLTDDNASD